MLANIISYIKKSWKTDSLIILLLFSAHSSIFGSYMVPTGSMKPTIQEQDRFWVNKLAYRFKLPFTKHTLVSWDQPKVGEIIAFKYPVDESLLFTKRVIGIPGDTIQIVNGILYRNGNPQTLTPITDKNGSLFFEEQLQTKSHLVQFTKHRASARNFGPLKVPDGSLFVMGDNRDNSHDSRFWGLVPMENVEGELVTRWFALNKSPLQSSVLKRLGSID